ncbi:hypothetical protein [Thermococcus sp. JdF3]|nr:hypothetical protein [Thermococcus sp. JdF3]
MEQDMGNTFMEIDIKNTELLEMMAAFIKNTANMRNMGGILMQSTMR